MSENKSVYRMPARYVFNECVAASISYLIPIADFGDKIFCPKCQNYKLKPSVKKAYYKSSTKQC